jgi:hypothetical protein
VLSEVGATATAYEGSVIPSSVHLLSLRVRDPEGGPAWGLRLLRTTRGLLCLQPGRVVDGRLGVLGEDGAFADDGAFHPYSTGFLGSRGCGTLDGGGDAFLNEQLHGIPASGLLDDRRYTAGGCYGAAAKEASCPATDLRTVYFGLLGPDAVSITHRTPKGAIESNATVAPYGAYLVVLPYSGARTCDGLFCSRGRFSTGGPELRPDQVIAEAHYSDAPPCRAPSSARLSLKGCPVVGYVAAAGSRATPTPAELAAPVTARVVSARHYCEHEASIVACDHGVPRGYRRIAMLGPPEVLVVVHFDARRAVTSFDSHYEIETARPGGASTRLLAPLCAGGTFGPTQTDLRAGQDVRYTMFADARCRGTERIEVGYVQVDGPSGSMPVPGLPGQSAAIPVGQTSVAIP